MDVQNLINSLPEILSCHPEVQLAYLFGSQAEGRAGARSDVDLAVLIDREQRPADPLERLRWRAELTHELVLALGADKVDLVVLNEAPPELAYHVIAAGRLLYACDDNCRVEYEVRAMSLYFDYLPVLRAQREQLLKGGGHDGGVQRYREALERTERTLAEIKGIAEEKPPGI
jgi:predicted nucleotidyltransferase